MIHRIVTDTNTSPCTDEGSPQSQHDNSRQAYAVRKRKRFIIASIGIVLVMTGVLTEVLVRLFLPYNTPGTIREYSLQYVPSIFSRYGLKPVNRVVEVSAAKGWGTKVEDDKYHRIYFINEFGYRGPSFKIPKPKGILRVVVLGGSAVFDIHAEEGMDWPHLVERYLKEAGASNLEIINAGIPGYASFDSLGRLYSQIWMWEPDYVILYNAWNDIKYFNKLSPANPLFVQIKPFDDRADPFQNYQSVIDQALSVSQVYMKIRNSYYGGKYEVGQEGRVSGEKIEEYHGEFGVKQFALNVKLVVDAARNVGAIPILATQATLISPTNNAEDKKSIAYKYVGLTHDGLVKAYKDCNEVIRNVGQEKKVYVIDLDEALSGNRTLFVDHVHTTRKGSEEIAKIVAKALMGKLAG